MKLNLKYNIVKNTISKIGLLTIALAVVFSSCIHKDFEEPPVVIIPEGAVLTIQDLYNIYDTLGAVKFTGDASVYAVVTMDDKSGNIYKSAYIQDGSKAINLHLLSSGGLYEGDSIRLYLKGLILSDYSGMMQLDSVHVDNNIVKLSTLRHVEPEVVEIDQITTGQFLAKLVKFENVQFVDEELGLTYANEEDLITENRTLEDENGLKIIVRTSGYASFAGKTLPEGRGSVVAIVGRFNDDWQLYIRGTNEVNFNQRRFGDYDTVLFAGFDGIDNGIAVSLTDWENYQQIGSISWLGSNNGESATVRIAGNGEANTTWLITPQVTINGAKLKFRTRGGLLTGATLKAYISNDYDGQGNAENATWTELSANIGTGPVSSFGDWTESGTIDLANYNGQAYIAFKYVTEAGQNGQFYLDDILVFKE